MNKALSVYCFWAMRIWLIFWPWGAKLRVLEVRVTQRCFRTWRHGGIPVKPCGGTIYCRYMVYEQMGIHRRRRHLDQRDSRQASRFAFFEGQSRGSRGKSDFPGARPGESTITPPLSPWPARFRIRSFMDFPISSY